MSIQTEQLKAAGWVPNDAGEYVNEAYHGHTIKLTSNDEHYMHFDENGHMIGRSIHSAETLQMHLARFHRENPK